MWNKRGGVSYQQELNRDKIVKISMDWEHTVRSKGLIPTLICCSKVNPFFPAVNFFKIELQVYFLCRFTHFSYLLVKSMTLLCFNLRGKQLLPFEAHAIWIARGIPFTAGKPWETKYLESWNCRMAAVRAAAMAVPAAVLAARPPAPR